MVYKSFHFLLLDKDEKSPPPGDVWEEGSDDVGWTEEGQLDREIGYKHEESNLVIPFFRLGFGFFGLGKYEVMEAFRSSVKDNVVDFLDSANINLWKMDSHNMIHISDVKTYSGREYNLSISNVSKEKSTRNIHVGSNWVAPYDSCEPDRYEENYIYGTVKGIEYKFRLAFREL